MDNGKLIFIGFIAFMFFVIASKNCSHDERSQRETQTVQYQKSPVDIIIRNLSNENNFSIILFDMDYNESDNQYKHKYNVILERDDSVYTEKSDWSIVSASFFKANMDNMGMTIASKKSGVVNKIPSPPGYNNYIGNEKYGQWKSRDGNSFWAFYGKYALLSSMFRMSMYPVYYSGWNNYNSNYYGRRAYYGSTVNGRSTYGTNSSYNKSAKNSSWNNKPSNFKSNVRSKVSRSTTPRTSTSAKRTHSSSRYSSSSSRSRSGGYGK